MLVLIEMTRNGWISSTGFGSEIWRAPVDIMVNICTIIWQGFWCILGGAGRISEASVVYLTFSKT